MKIFVLPWNWIYWCVKFAKKVCKTFLECALSQCNTPTKKRNWETAFFLLLYMKGDNYKTNIHISLKNIFLKKSECTYYLSEYYK